MTIRDGLRPIADGVGIVSSFACALHCLIVPITLVVGPVGALPHVDDETFHRVLLWIVIPSAVFAFLVGCMRHRDRGVLGLGLVGLTLLVAAFTIFHDLLGENGERVTATLASACLIAAHVRNYRLCRAGACSHEETHEDAPECAPTEAAR